ncbi:LytTR family DNA-binding domain-containing protein [Plesiomonas shigelloides subsp. oncorhynchi]|nr:LytTR family DNA-binding domain-containing protein [Plesiomonas shigelloides]
MAVADVLYFRASDKYISVFRAGVQRLEEYLLRISLRELLAQLDPAQFWQIHRAVVVNVAQIDKVKRSHWSHVCTYWRAKLPVSRAQQGLFK